MIISVWHPEGILRAGKKAQQTFIPHMKFLMQLAREIAGQPLGPLSIWPGTAHRRTICCTYVSSVVVLDAKLPESCYALIDLLKLGIALRARHIPDNTPVPAHIQSALAIRLDVDYSETIISKEEKRPVFMAILIVFPD